MTDIDTSTPPAPGLTLGEVADAVATWALMGTVLALCWVSDTLTRRDQQRRAPGPSFSVDDA